MSPSAAAAIAACRPGDTVMALPLTPRPKAEISGTLMWPMPRLEAIAIGAKMMRGVEQADIDLVAHIGPGNFPHQFDVEPFGGAKPLVDGDDQRRRVDQRDEPDPQPLRAHFSISDAVITDWAMSAIFFFSFIAVVRSST